MGNRSFGVRVVALVIALVVAQVPSQLPLVSRHVPATASAAPAGRIYVGNQGSGTVSAIDPLTNSVIATIDVGGTPYGVTAKPDGSQVWVVNYGSQKVDIIDTATNTIVDSASLVGAPHSLAFNPTGTRAYLSVDDSTNPLASNRIWVIDTTKPSTDPGFFMATIPVGRFPTGVTVRPDGKRLYVADYDQGVGSTVTVIDTDPGSQTQNTVVATITVGTGPFNIAVRPDNARAYVTNLGSNNLSVIDTATNSVVATIAVDVSPTFVALTKNGATAYVTNIASGTVSVIDTATNTNVGSVSNIGGSPRGIALSPDDKYAYVAVNEGLAVIGGGTLVTTIAVGAQPFYVAVLPGSVLSGIASCTGLRAPVLLPGATVDLYSGSVIVGSTLADAQTAAYAFFGLAPNATYTLVYTKIFITDTGNVRVTCSTSVTTDANGSGTGGAGTTIPNRHNHTWPKAFEIASGATITDYVFETGQSTWFKIPVTRGQRVTVKLTNVPADFSLALYKDIGKLYLEEIAALTGSDPLAAVSRLDASVSPDALSPDELSPDELSPDELSPDALSPDELSPDELSPDELSPDELSPDELSPDALSPDELSPDALSPDELSPDELSAAYSGAQTAALIGVSAHVGLSPEQITRNTWDNTGYFYMRVRGHNGAYDASTPFTLQATITDVSCPGATLADYPVALAPANSLAMTLIFTDTARLTGDTAGFLTTLNAFKARSDVKGVVVDLASIAGLPAAYAQWDANQACPSAANVVAHSIKDIIKAYASANPTLRYVVLAGDDHVVPFFRQPDQSGLGSEKDYFPSVLDPTASQASLRLGYVLTQDFYGSLTPISRFDHELFVPDLAVGRLVETIPQMTAVINAFLFANGTVAPTNALVVGYDFLSDTATFMADQLQANALAVDRSLIQPVGDSSSSPTAWTADQLKTKLFGATSFGIVGLNGHFSANTMLAADFATRLRTSDVAALPAADTRFRNTLVLSTGCHSGYDTVDGDQTALTDPFDWAQALAARGATVVGGTGYQYGDTDFMKYTEQILANMTLELRYGAGRVPVGIALANAKRTYLATLASLSGIDEKALAEATLYGLPMLGYDLPAGSRLARPTSPTLGGLVALTSPGLSFASLTPSYALHRNTRTLTITGGGTAQAIYYDIDGMVAVSAGMPVLPQLTVNGSITGQALRGAVLKTATYADEQNVIPFTDVATTEVRGVHPRYSTDVFTPVRPFDLNQYGGTTNFISTPFQFRSTGGATIGTARRITNESFRLYYSTLTYPRALAASPAVQQVTLVPDGAGNVDVTVLVGGLSSVGVQEVFATYTGEAGSLYGQWNSTEPLTAAGTVTRGDAFGTLYTGSIPLGSTLATDLRVVIQAVGGNALVTWASNDGAYYRVVDETATISDPKITTALSLAVPASGTYRSTVPVSATLTANGAPLAGKPVAFRSGGIRVNATTNASGVASTQLFLTSAPGIATVTVGFAEDLDYLGSGTEAQITINKAPSSFVSADPGPIPTGGSVVLATLFGGTETLGSQPVTLVGGGRTVQTYSDGYGRVRLDTTDGFPSGAYSVSLSYDGNDRYLPAATISVVTVIYDPTTYLTAGGWILTPPNSVGLVTGKKANFGVNLKYKNGTTIPTGSLEFVALESNVSLKATSFDWLAISGSTAEVMGHATVNGVAGWSFRVTMVDGSPDRFTTSIWQDGVTSYASPTYRAGNALGGGSVVVH